MVCDCVNTITDCFIREFKFNTFKEPKKDILRRDFLTNQSKKVFFKETLEADNLTFEKDTCFPEAYKIFFPLDKIPDSKWENCLNKMSEMAKTYLGRKITLEGDKLVLVGTLDDMNGEMFEKLQKILDDINRCV